MRKGGAMMQAFDFIIVAAGLDPQADDFETRFYDAGCEDATISFQRGHVIVDFSRESGSIEDAVESAMEAVRNAGATVVRVEPDPLVSLSDIAARAGLSRAALSQYANGQRGRGFPSPVARVTTESPLWAWAEVAQWLWEKKKVDRAVVEIAGVVEDVNASIDAALTDRRSQRVKRSGGRATA